MKMVNDGDLWACTDDTVRFQFERTATSFSPKRAYHFFQALRISLVILREDVGVRKMQQYQRTKFQEETASCLGLGLLNLFVLLVMFGMDLTAVTGSMHWRHLPGSVHDCFVFPIEMNVLKTFILLSCSYFLGFYVTSAVSSSHLPNSTSCKRCVVYQSIKL